METINYEKKYRDALHDVEVKTDLLMKFSKENQAQKDEIKILEACKRGCFWWKVVAIGLLVYSTIEFIYNR